LKCELALSSFHIYIQKLLKETNSKTIYMIARKYDLLEKINEGAFGTVFKAENKRTKELVAIKFETNNGTIKSLKNEAKIYQYLGKLDGFPQLKTYGTTNNVSYLVINLLGQSLSSILETYGRLSLNTTLLLGVQIIQRLQALHNMFLLHRDIKPSNFVFGLGDRTNKLYLIDLGFSKRYMYDNEHIEEKQLRHIVGSPNFVSLHVHNLVEPSRRDDLEAGLYVILTMLFGNLNWVNSSDMKTIVLLKNQLTTSYKLPTCLAIMLHYIRNLAFNEPPDYDYLIQLMLDEINK
jgi:serine/threonine protein kinase